MNLDFHKRIILYSPVRAIRASKAKATYPNIVQEPIMIQNYIRIYVYIGNRKKPEILALIHVCTISLLV